MGGSGDRGGVEEGLELGLDPAAGHCVGTFQGLVLSPVRKVFAAQVVVRVC